MLSGVVHNEGEEMNKKMLWMSVALIVIALVIAPVSACACKITGIGFIRGDDGKVWANFGGNAMPTKDGVKGEWEHNNHVTGNNFHAHTVTEVECWSEPAYAGPDAPAHPAPLNSATWSGSGTLNGVETCSFTAVAYDINEGGIHRDGYEIYVFGCPGAFQDTATSDACYPLAGGQNPLNGCLAGGNFQIHEAAPWA